jgi:hypothetical protein
MISVDAPRGEMSEWVFGIVNEPFDAGRVSKMAHGYNP